MSDRRCWWLPAGTALLLVAAGCGGAQPDGRPAPSASSSVSASTSAEAPASGRLLYSAFDEQDHTFGSTFTSAADGSDVKELRLPGPEGGGRWSHDGTEIAVMTLLPDGRVGTAVIGPDGAVHRVLGIPDPHLNLVCTAWAPDDRRLACEGFDDDHPGARGIYQVSAADGGGMVRLTSAPTGGADLPGDYSPDGRSLVFGRCLEEEKCTLMTVSTEDRRVQVLDAGLGPVEDPGRYSPDGSALVTSAHGVLLVLDARGRVRHRVTQDGHYLFGASWSPDGRWLAYSDSVDGAPADVFLARADGSDPRPVTRTAANEIVVEWGAPRPGSHVD